MITATTVPLIFVSVWLWRLTKGDLLSMVLFVSIFEAASGLNVGGLGIAPWILVLVFGLAYQSIKGRVPWRFMPGTNLVSVRILLAFVAYAFFTGMVYPFLFEGVPVLSSHGDMIHAAPLAWGMANVAQLCYLLAAVALFLVATFSSRQALRGALVWYVRGCVTASLFALYQLANAVAGIPYPSAVLYSNPRYVIYPAYMINGMWRLNSTFTEASAMAGHLSVGIALCAWDVVTRPLRWGPCLSLVLMTGCLLLTLSTSGYLALGLILLVVAAVALHRLLTMRSATHVQAILFLAAIACGIVVFAGTGAPATVSKVLRSVLIEKQDSSSYRERTASNRSAMETARQTYYLGAGWGSVRCSSLGSGLMATVGAPGVLLFVAFLASVFVPPARTARLDGDDNLFAKSLFGVFVILSAMMIASNEPVQPILWILFAGAVAGPAVLRHGGRIDLRPSGPPTRMAWNASPHPAKLPAR